MKDTDPASKAMLIGSGIILGTFIPFTLLVHLALALTGGGSAPWNPFLLLLRVITQEVSVSAPAWIIVGCFFTLLVLVVGFVGFKHVRRRRSRKRGDSAAKHLGGKAASASVRTKSVQAKASAFGLDPSKHPGYPLGNAVADGGCIWGDWESVSMVLAGPRTGKTTAFAIPLILASPGSVLATSNKRDIVDATLGVREKVGQVWLFDPCSIRKEEARCYWNPLTYVIDDAHYDGTVVSRASELSRILGDAARAGNTGSRGYDSFWDGGGDRIRSELIAAAALGNKSMADVYTWVAQELNREPVKILKAAQWDQMADSLEAAIDLPEETRGGMWACARMGLEWLEDPGFAQWWQSGGGRHEFSPAEFSQATDQTLYSLSRDASAVTPLVAALTAITCKAAEFTAESRGGRLATPMMVILDEAANVCPWRELPKLYSHFGSKGILLQTILQSWSQGVDVWGETGMMKLWSASNNAIYAGGMKEVPALENFSKLIGTHYVDQISRSTSSGVTTRSVNTESSERPIATIDDLASLPEWRAWLFATHARPVLLEILPWFTGTHKTEITDSLATYGAQ